MKVLLLAAVSVLCATSAFGQTLEAASNPPQQKRFFARSEYLLWWLNGAPLPPLLTTGNAFADPYAGVLGSPTTRVLFGGGDLVQNAFNGARLTVGLVPTSTGTLGVEASGFLLAAQTTNVASGANGSGSPLLGIPILNTNRTEQRLLVSSPGNPQSAINQFNGVALNGVGAYAASYKTDLWGAGLDGVYRLVRTPQYRVDVLAGLAYRRLKEDLNMWYGLGLINDTQLNGTFGGNAQDSFSTTNDFYGARLGTRVSSTFGRFSIDATASLALGATVQQLAIAGSGTFFGSLATQTQSPYGVFAQQSNIGSYTRVPFSAIPELNLRVSYALTDSLEVSIGYNVMYWSNVIRPGPQIDRMINTSAGTQRQDFFTGLQGDVPPMGGNPAPLFNQSSLLAQGISIGATLRF
jgi:hypothetical protein